ncbi:SNF2-related protein [Bifidobacterium boum]|uniref:SNF2-related protein n=1 Tax=Bifidobacterium boum TaxID=78343 RepID=UPI003F91E4C8
MPFPQFATMQLGTGKRARSPMGVGKNTGGLAKGFLHEFDELWNNPELVQDVTDAVVNGIEQMYRENASELIYYMALNHIFAQFLDDTTDDTLAKDSTGFRDSRIWNMLYDFQKDAALAIINKLETYNGCILADSFGLGKTFTALALIEYFERRNRNVLVLCPQKAA